MTEKKTYFSPKIEIILLDADISICMATEGTPTGPGDKPEGAPVNTFDTKEDNSGFSEDPFKR